jgi:hypothetical protein
LGEVGKDGLPQVSLLPRELSPEPQALEPELALELALSEGDIEEHLALQPLGISQGRSHDLGYGLGLESGGDGTPAKSSARRCVRSLQKSGVE